MSLSFKDSLEKNNEIKPVVATESATAAAFDVEDMNVEPYGVMTLDENYGIAAYAGDDGNWTEDKTYKQYYYFKNKNGYSEKQFAFSDDNLSEITSAKEIKLDSSQFNITQEENSQYIPFKMPRYYDGVDLTAAALSIHYVRSDGKHGVSIPVNVKYSDNEIKFGWLIDGAVTSVPGKIKFEIRADGMIVYNEGSERIEKAYTWKTKYSGDLNVLESLCGYDCNDAIAINDSWVQELIDSVVEKVASQIAGVEIDGQVEAAQKAAKDAADAADSAKGYADIASSAATTSVNTALKDYYKKNDVDNKIGDLGTDNSVSEYIDTKLGNVTDANGNELTVAEYVQQEVTAVDVSDQLGDLGEHETVKDYVDAAVNSVDVSEQLKDYAKSDDVYNKTETYSKDEINEALSNVSVDLTGYATETYVDNKVSPISSSVSTNTENISSLSTTVGKLQSDVNAIDKSPRKTYEATYGDITLDDGTVQESMFTLWETEGSDEPAVKSRFKIVGGGGGGAAAGNNLTISYDKDKDGKNITQYVFTKKNTEDNEAIIYYGFSGTDSAGDDVSYANATWKTRRGTSGAWGDLLKTTIYPGDKVPFNISKYFYKEGNVSAGTYQIQLITTDESGGYASKTWIIQIVDVRLESSFNDTVAYPMGEVYFNYTPYGSVSKVVHFVLDGTEVGTVTTSSSDIPTSYPLMLQTHGSHLLDVYMTATINNDTISSNHIYKDILCCDPTSSIPVIGCATPVINVMQYNTVNIKYIVVDPSTETPEVTWYINGNLASVEKLTEKDKNGYYTYPYKANNDGVFELTVVCGEAEPKKITINVEKLNINVAPVTAGLAFDFNPVGYSNSPSNRLWSDGDVDMTVSDNFDWVNGGYHIDENGDQYFCVKAGTNAVINYNLFADDPRANGKEFKVIFKTKNIRKRDTSFLTCMNENIGLDMKVENATIYEKGGLLKSDYCEDTIIEYEFNINKDTDMRIVMSYEDGTPSKPYEYKEDVSSFKQSSPQPITIGSEDCDVLIYRMKAYSNSLTDTDIKNNFIADARNADEMIARYNRNQIYNEDGSLVSTSANGDFYADALMKAAPNLRYIFIEVPQFTNDKDNKIDGCNVYFRYPAGTRPQDNWNCTGVRHRGQGTSSNLYGYAGRNIDLCMDRDESLFTYTDDEGNTVESSTITLTDTSVPTDYLNIKVNIASSENANNAEMARRFNEYQPFLRYARKKNSKVKDTMEFYNCVVFIRETSEDLSNVPHREFNDTNWHFYGIGNVGDSKKTDDTRVNDKRDPKEHVVEIMDVDKLLSSFPTGKEGNAVCPIGEWREGNTAYDILHSTDYVYDDEDGSFKSFGGETYEFRYEMKNITEEQREANINTWRNLYKFIVTSADDEYYAHLKDYFVVDSALYYYLFTERYTMVDNRAKNSFWHYGKVYISRSEANELGETEAGYYIIDDEAAAINDGYRYDLTFGYDFDTSLGIDNTGDYVFSYGKEDTDYYVNGDPTSDYVFRVANSTFFCRLRDLFPAEMQRMFKNREEKNAWSSTSLVNQWDNSQAQFPEELWRLDYQRKYYRTYLGLSIDNSMPQGIDKTFLIGKFFGRKKYARRAFELNQEIYFATKYFGNKALEDVFWIRGNVPIGSNIKPNYSLTLVPYSDMYICVKYGSTGEPIHSEENGKPKRIKAGEEYVFENSADRMDFIYVYAASRIQEVGDLSRCYVGDNNFSSATRLQKLVIGSTDSGYENTFMKEVLVTNNPLLEYLDLRNISGINTVIDVGGCSNLKELYAEGTNAIGAIFANGGLLHTAHLPNTTKSLSMKNLNYITDDGFVVADGFDNLETLIVENTPNINTYNIIADAPNLSALRLIDLNWDESYQIKDCSVFDRLLTVGGRDSSGYETDMSVLTGKVHVPTIKQKQLEDYQEAWSDLEITYDSKIEQHPVIFVNHDGAVLCVQHVVNAEYATDPVKLGLIPTPTKESTVSTNYTYVGWDKDLTTMPIRQAQTVTATYSESVRQYTVKYVSMGETVHSETADYGTNVEYDGVPTYNKGETEEKYYLFNRWDKSGFVDGEKTINAIFDSFQYKESYTELVETSDDVDLNGSHTIGNFANEEINDLKKMLPVHIYALTKLGLADADDGIIEKNDKYSFQMGYDVAYDDIISEEIVVDGIYQADKTKATFDGTNYIDTGIRLFNEDKDFVIAIDYKVSSSSKANSVMAQCYNGSFSEGFKLSYNGTVNVVYGGSSSLEGDDPSPTSTVGSADNREMLIIRHKKGDNKLYTYTSNLSGDTEKYVGFIRTDGFTIDDTLVLGSSKPDSSSYENKIIGDIYWCKIWWTDLGEQTCRKLACWIHENIEFAVCGFKRFYLSDNSGRSSFSLLATHLLDRNKAMNSTTSNGSVGGWDASELNEFLNGRFYDALPVQIKPLLKQVKVLANDGDYSAPKVATSDCYVTIPARIELETVSLNSTNANIFIGEMYEGLEDATIYSSPSNRIRSHSNGDTDTYWTRTAHLYSNQNYFYAVESTGAIDQVNTASEDRGILLEISL